jgi:hypothetical protein
MQLRKTMVHTCKELGMARVLGFPRGSPWQQGLTCELQPELLYGLLFGSLTIQTNCSTCGGASTVEGTERKPRPDLRDTLKVFLETKNEADLLKEICQGFSCEP